LITLPAAPATRDGFDNLYLFAGLSRCVLRGFGNR
jgi:hypothetical protein